jgi:CRISPR-associated protein Csx14
MVESEYAHILLATMGGQPQIVTFTLDLLLQRNIPISEVHIVHPSTPRINRAVQILNDEFRGDRYRSKGQVIHFHSHVLRHDGQPLEDLNDETRADDVLNTMHGLIRSFKERHCIVNFSITGGRRLMSILSMSAAILSMDLDDHMWHIYTPDTLRERARDGTILHVAPDEGVRLIEVPLTRLSEDVRATLSFDASAREIIRAQEEQVEAEERVRCERIVSQLTPRRLEVLMAFAEGLHPAQVAEKLSISMPTVSTHTTVLLSLCRDIWPMRERERLDYRFLQLKFARYFRE